MVTRPKAINKAAEENKGLMSMLFETQQTMLFGVQGDKNDFDYPSSEDENPFELDVSKVEYAKDDAKQARTSEAASPLKKKMSKRMSS